MSNEDEESKTKSAKRELGKTGGTTKRNRLVRLEPTSPLDPKWDYKAVKDSKLILLHINAFVRGDFFQK